MKVPLLDLKAHLAPYRENIRAAIDDVLDSAHFILGQKVAALEASVASYVGVGHAVGVSSGTDALLVSLMALDVGPGDVVVTTPYSFFATAGVIARLGARPAFVDIEADTYNMDHEALSEWLRAHPDLIERVRAIMPVHLYGQCARMDPIAEIARRWDIPIVEDAAQALGAICETETAAKRAGGLGTLGCFSFFPSKNLGGLGDGGMVVTNNDGLAEKLVRLRIHGAKPKYYHSMVGGNFRLDAIQAAALLVLFPHLDAWHAKRQENAAYYDANIDLDGVDKPVCIYSRSCHVYNQYVIRVPERRDELKVHLANNGVGTEVYYPVPLHLQDCFRHLGYRQGELPNSEMAADRTLALPVYPELSNDMQDYVVETLGGFYG